MCVRADDGWFLPVLLSLFAQIVTCGMVENSQRRCEMVDLIAVDLCPASLGLEKGSGTNSQMARRVLRTIGS
jgi:hypothetical protein